MLFVFFFFFKQKTAYDMRISDWSSDVCSSDLFWEGGVNRSDIIEMFDVSVPQASKDLTLYQERAPHNALYDKSAKRYVASEHFEPHFLKPDPDGYLSRLRSVAEGLIDLSESWITQVPDTDIAFTPRRDIDASVLRTVLSAVDRKSTRRNSSH